MQGLERSSGHRAADTAADKAAASGDWLVERHGVAGNLSVLRARLQSRAFSRHRHDTYTVSVTEQGVQEFGYRGSVHRSLPGQVVILHPDEAHDGRPATAEGFTFRSVYLEPLAVGEALREMAGRPVSLPFAHEPVVTDRVLARRLLQATAGSAEPLEAFDLLRDLCAGLLRHGRARPAQSRRKGVGEHAFRRVSHYLDAHFQRTVSAEELESVCGESRHNIAEEFRRRCGTSPHRYLVMRRVQFVRARVASAPSLAGLAMEAGFADQAHMTRHFKAAYGLTPAAYARLLATG